MPEPRPPPTTGLPTLVKVVDPEAIRICLTRLWNLCMDSSSTRKKHCAVRSLVTYESREQ